MTLYTMYKKGHMPLSTTRPQPLEKLNQQLQWLKDDEQTAYRAGFLLGARLSRVMIEARIGEMWNGDLHRVARQTYVRLKNAEGMSPTQFSQTISESSSGALQLAVTDIPYPEYMEGSTKHMIQYGLGIFSAVDEIYANGTNYFIEGLFSHEQGIAQIRDWVAGLLTELNREASSEVTAELRPWSQNHRERE